ncbi:hypothetical protein E5348_04490 [Enterococcus hirae]|uniref:hypothetical protein n=1 Tax=Enterococcus hirae TaxID=1354 RepID=UPI001094C70E|nr:hypothetical protein [Enterococcus hirae]TGY25670.1 hypothetical protein E5348_04490 [Enterococcus hirae]
MNEKIENLIEELIEECNKQDVPVLLSVEGDETTLNIASGNAIELAKMHIGIEIDLLKQLGLDDADDLKKLVLCQSIKQLFNIDSKEDFADLMTRISKEEFNDERKNN